MEPTFGMGGDNFQEEGGVCTIYMSAFFYMWIQRWVGEEAEGGAVQSVSHFAYPNFLLQAKEGALGLHATSTLRWLKVMQEDLESKCRALRIEASFSAPCHTQVISIS